MVQLASMTTTDLAMPPHDHFPAGLDLPTLLDRAKDARSRAYAPYSGFLVGAALLTADGSIVTGGNVENGSYGMTICAERAAVVRAVAEGHKEFRAIVIAADSDRVRVAAPCGACLQVLAEFDPDDEMLVAFPHGDSTQIVRLGDLLPVRFRLNPETSA